ncbi:MAG: lytic transglycosylase domain-containing protein [Desulfobaccales bacterium]|nr:lytic transglycosylase domain-containing protein [Desulfobaccales bacterium]
MMIRLFILIFIFSCAFFIPAALAEPALPVGSDGTSLVLEGNDSWGKAISGDTLYDLLGKEVQVFIFNNKARVWWPRAYTLRPASGYSRPLANPQLEALIFKYARLYGVDPSLVRAVMRHESAFNPGAVSPKGAQGLMQLMPGTAALMGVNNPFDPEQNIAGGVGYLRRCLDRFGHNVPLAVAAYNAGPESVARCAGIPPYTETQLFVQNVMGTYNGPYQKGKLFAAPGTPPAPAGKGSSQAFKKATQAANQEQAANEVRRPRPKIIEVRSFKRAEPQRQSSSE